MSALVVVLGNDKGLYTSRKCNLQQHTWCFVSVVLYQEFKADVRILMLESSYECKNKNVMVRICIEHLENTHRFSMLCVSSFLLEMSWLF